MLNVYKILGIPNPVEKKIGPSKQEIEKRIKPLKVVILEEENEDDQSSSITKLN